MLTRRVPLQRRTPLKGGGTLARKTPLKQRGNSETDQVKDSIQALLRAIVIKRDGGCILRYIAARYPGREFPQCGGYTKAGELILQADHLITRANGATYADIRLIVCVCLAHHAWKSKGNNRRKAEYDELVKTIIEPERVALWETCERDSWKPTRYFLADWKKEEAFLRTKLFAMNRVV